jgi:hypothetical protein
VPPPGRCSRRGRPPHPWPRPGPRKERRSEESEKEEIRKIGR